MESITNSQPQKKIRLGHGLVGVGVFFLAVIAVISSAVGIAAVACLPLLIFLSVLTVVVKITNLAFAALLGFQILSWGKCALVALVLWALRFLARVLFS